MQLTQEEQAALAVAVAHNCTCKPNTWAGQRSQCGAHLDKDTVQRATGRRRWIEQLRWEENNV